MTRVTCDLTISVDGYVAGPDQSMENPLGRGAEPMHDWMFGRATDADRAVIEEWQSGVGAYVMGRNMFGPPSGGPWDADWRGWWGEDPPYHVPVFVVTHHEREPLEMAGGTTFHFVTEGAGKALELAREAARDREVAIAGGASTVNQYLALGAIEQLHLHIAPVMLGAGERLFTGVPPLELTQLSVVGTPAATHVKYAVGSAA